jgi:hypothetical protein
MKIVAWLVALMVAASNLSAQELIVELTNPITGHWFNPQWKSTGDSPNVTLKTVDRNWLGTIREAQIYFNDQLTYRLRRDSWRVYLEDEQGNPRMERPFIPRHYITGDGILLRRRINLLSNRVLVIHPDGTRLAEGRIQSRLLKHRLTIRILTPSELDEELMALMAFDMVDVLRSR